MTQPFGKYLMFKNRLKKRHRHLVKWARRTGVSCYRLYTHDLPEFPLMIELYEDAVYVAEYKRRHNLSDEEYQSWVEGCSTVIAGVLAVPEGQIFWRLRQRQDHKMAQYEKLAVVKAEKTVQENGLQFIINLTDYLDTGLFLDHRDTRVMVRNMCKGKSVLNLFCYTGSFSVYAMDGGATAVTSVDLSKTYLAWTEKNIALNFSQHNHHCTVHADVKSYLKTVPPASFDLIIMDPPTFSNSKRMADVLDIQRDHVPLINDCMQALTPGGILIFSTNYTKFLRL